MQLNLNLESNLSTRVKLTGLGVPKPETQTALKYPLQESVHALLQVASTSADILVEFYAERLNSKRLELLQRLDKIFSSIDHDIGGSGAFLERGINLFEKYLIAIKSPYFNIERLEDDPRFQTTNSVLHAVEEFKTHALNYSQKPNHDNAEVVKQLCTDYGIICKSSTEANIIFQQGLKDFTLEIHKLCLEFEIRHNVTQGILKLIEDELQGLSDLYYASECFNGYINSLNETLKSLKPVGAI